MDYFDIRENSFKYIFFQFVDTLLGAHELADHQPGASNKKLDFRQR